MSSSGPPHSPGRGGSAADSIGSIGSMLVGRGGVGTIPSPFTEAEDTSPFSGDTRLGDLLTALSSCGSNISVHINRSCRSADGGEGEDDGYDEEEDDDNDYRRFNEATVRLLATELIRLLQAISELLVRAQDDRLGQSERETAYHSATRSLSEVVCRFWPLLDNTSELNPILAGRLRDAESQIRSETGGCIDNAYQDIAARVRALRLLLRNMNA